VELVIAKGSPYERGAIIGQAMAASAVRSVAFNRRYAEGHGLDRAALEAILAPYLAAARSAYPDLVEQIRGIADGAGVPFLDGFFANAFEEVYGIVELAAPSPVALERCTDVVLRGPGCTLLGHTEQWYAGDDGAAIMVLDIPDSGPAVLAPVAAGALPLVGMNERGAAFGTMSLSATDERVGIPRALVARDLLDARDPDDAIARATRDGRAGGYSYLAAFPGGRAFAIETTASRHAVIETDVHTNHALDPVVGAAACEASPGSRSRLARVRALAAAAATGSPAPTVAAMRSILADHGADGQDICVHPDPADGDEGADILFAMICEPETRTMWVAPGHPCTSPFEVFTFDHEALDGTVRR
jgi:isopenicillin-N N-acyltransferase-like protein